MVSEKRQRQRRHRLLPASPDLTGLPIPASCPECGADWAWVPWGWHPIRDRRNHWIASVTCEQGDWYEGELVTERQLDRFRSAMGETSPRTIHYSQKGRSS